MGLPKPSALAVRARAELPTEHGRFDAYVFTYGEDAAEHVALVRGRVAGVAAVTTRIHSECLTGEAFASRMCDCGPQLAHALGEIARRGRGVVVYLRQEGRGIGLANKLRAYELQARGADTVDANRLLGLPDDARTYEAAAAMLSFLGVRSVSLITNNPAKLESLSRLGIDVAERLPSLVPVGHEAVRYLDAKRERMRHLLPKDRPAVPQSVSHAPRRPRPRRRRG